MSMADNSYSCNKSSFRAEIIDNLYGSTVITVYSCSEKRHFDRLIPPTKAAFLSCTIASSIEFQLEFLRNDCTIAYVLFAFQGISLAVSFGDSLRIGDAIKNIK
jgi:hypothetical protein